ncbi:MAG: hypothetical protein II263_04450 [Lachnospiraceae bacterium]|nr:hypothetical protein [Lachnospiraceae bacterium]
MAAGQNVGAKKLKRVKEGMFCACKIGFVYSAIAFVVLYFFGDKIVLLFMDAGETEIIGRAHRFLITNSAFYWALTLVNVVRFTIQGMGFSVFAILAGVCEMFARSAVGFLLVPMLGFGPVCFGNPSAWVAADLFLVPAFYLCYKNLKNKFCE